MLRRTGYVLVLLASINIMGGHWAVLQTVAWVGMAVDYSQNYGIEHGLLRTFDGDHPCQLCQKVMQGRAAEQKGQPKDLDLKLAKQPTIFSEGVRSQAVFPSNEEMPWASPNFTFSILNYPPPVPPPRLT